MAWPLKIPWETFQSRRTSREMSPSQRRQHESNEAKFHINTLTRYYYRIRDRADEFSGKLGNNSSDIIQIRNVILQNRATSIYVLRLCKRLYLFQFMVNYEATNWSRVLAMPLSVTLERVRSQVLLRPEFKNVGDLSREDKEAAQFIKRICSLARSARFK